MQPVLTSNNLRLCVVEYCEYKHISHIFRDFHYKSSHMGGGISFCFCLRFADEIIGGAVYGKPRHDKSYDANVLDLRRFALIDSAPHNSESFFLSKTIAMLAKNKQASAILTFADETQGHVGTIYKACNFRLIGITPPSKHIMWKDKQYHMRSLTIDRPYSYLLREAIKTGEAQIITGLPKRKYMYEIHRKT